MAERDTIEDVVGRVGKGLNVILNEEKRFDVILMMAGTNDLGLGYPAETIFENVKRLHEMCHEAQVRTVALSIPPNLASEETGSLYRERWLEVNQMIREWACGETAPRGVALFVD